VPKCNGDEEGMTYLYDVVKIDIQLIKFYITLTLACKI
jgi:hypothetical protein